MFIVITGPESSGKTTLASYLGEKLGAAVVEEQARRILSGLKGGYSLHDIIEIGRAQRDAVDAAMHSGHEIVLSDTYMLELKVWTEERFDGEPIEIREMRNARKPDIYVLCHPDLPWEADPLRENPDDRQRLFYQYAAHAKQSGSVIVEAYGSGFERMHYVLQSVRDEIEKILP